MGENNGQIQIVTTQEVPTLIKYKLKVTMIIMLINYVEEIGGDDKLY